MREISEIFAQEFRKNVLFELYQKHQNELFLGVRDNQINLYYNALSVCEVSMKAKGGFSCKTSSKYLGQVGKNRLLTVRDTDICDNYSAIKGIMHDVYGSKEKEKWAQQELVLRNNLNVSSNWYCIDMEYVRENKIRAGRIDIIVLSKAKPHRVAIIEVKYNLGAVNGKSGVYKHVSDFYDIVRIQDSSNEFKSYIMRDIVGIVASMNRIFKSAYPLKLEGISDMKDEPEFYIITLDNNPLTQKHTTPKMTMGGYVFNKDNPKYIKAGTRRQTTKGTVESIFGDITNPANDKLYAHFLFSRDVAGSITITDIIDDKSYEREF